MTIAVVAALPEELAPLVRRLTGRRPEPNGEGLPAAFDGVDLRLMVTGDGAHRAGAALANLLRTHSLDVVIGIGIAGGLTADLARGQLVVVDRVLDEASGRSYEPPPSRWLERGRRVAGVVRGTAVSAHAIAGDGAAKGRLAKLAAAPAVVDLESAAWAEAAHRAGVPFVLARVVTDRYDEDLPLDFEGLRDASGAVDRGRVLRAAALRPATWPQLMRLRRRLARAGEALADWSLEVLAPSGPEI